MRVDVTPLKDALRDSLLGLYCLSNREAFMIIQRGVGGDSLCGRSRAVCGGMSYASVLGTVVVYLQSLMGQKSPTLI